MPPQGRPRKFWAIVGVLSLAFALVLAVKARIDAGRWKRLEDRVAVLLSERSQSARRLKETAAALEEEKRLREALAQSLALEQAKNRTLIEENAQILKDKEALEARLKGVNHGTP